MNPASQFGIYLNSRERKVVRINSTYWIPQDPGWIYLTPEVNATLVQIRGLVKEKGLMPDPETLTWGSLPLREE